MQSFKVWLEDAWGDSQFDKNLLSKIDNQMQELEKDLTQLTQKLSHGNGALTHATERMFRNWYTLRNTINTATQFNRDNPERGDHPPISNS